MVNFPVCVVNFDMCSSTCQIKNTINSSKKKLMPRSLAKLEAVEAFLKVFNAVRAAGQTDPEAAAKDIAAIIADKRNKDIV